MKTWRLLAASLIIFGLGWNVQTGPAAESAEAQVAIETIRMDGAEIVVTVRVPAGVKKVTLESRPRLGQGSWNPVAVQRIEDDSEDRVITFRVRGDASMVLLRVRADAEEALPASFYSGESSFAEAGSPDATADSPPDAFGPSREFDGAPPAPGEEGGREVVESDIWRIRGDTLFFFNQLRGLQVIDISNPEAPAVTGMYALPSAGEQMYVMDDDKVVLLTRGSCGWQATSESAVICLRIVDGQPEVVGEFGIPGQIRESRLVGSALYVVSERYRPVTITEEDGQERQVWEAGSLIASFDLADFAAPQERSNEWITGSNNAIMATDQYLFVANRGRQFDWRSPSLVHVFDIAAVDGTVVKRAEFTVRGQVRDKFKMNLNGTVFTVVSEDRRDDLTTRVETYSLADPSAPVALGVLDLIRNERLFATRFAGDRLYVVTFEQIDPLWIIDLKDPSAPKKMGVLEIPGWSTYIHPLGDLLVTVGIDNTEGWRTSVQLFDVSDPGNPFLVNKVLLGQRYSSSEANQDEKALRVLSEEQLILVPYSSWEENESIKRVQLIDLNPDGLVKRGFIDHEMPARRSTLHRDRIISISGMELLTVDATDRDAPVVVAELELAFPVDRLFLKGDYLVTLSHGWQASSQVRILSANDPEALLARVELSPDQILGADVAGDRLVVLQGQASEQVWSSEEEAWTVVEPARLTMSLFDLSELPEVKLLGQTEVSSFGGDEEGGVYWTQMNALWPQADTVVWAPKGGGTYYYWGWDVYRSPGLVGDAFVGDALMPWPGYWWGDSTFFVCFDVSSDTPELLSTVDLQERETPWSNLGDSFAAGDLVFSSRQTSYFDETYEHPPVVREVWDERSGETITVTNYPAPGAWVTGYYLDVINYADPELPVVRSPVNIPGRLLGIAAEGNLIFTQASRYEDLTTYSGWAEWVEASAYDGVEAFLIDSLKLAQRWPHPVLATDQGHLLLGVPGDGEEAAPRLEVWAVAGAGEFERIESQELSVNADELAKFETLLAVKGNRDIALFELSDSGGLTSMGNETGKGCIWYNLSYADGAVGRGLWVPAGIYGVVDVDVTTSSSE